MENQKQRKYLKDYKAPFYTTPKTELEFKLGFKQTEVKATYLVSPSVDAKSQPLELMGEDLGFVSLHINGTELKKDTDFSLSKTGLTVHKLPDGEFKIEIKNTICPEENTALEGLYKSGDILCTQNEPEGFRKITYSIDRPDNMSVFRVKMTGDKKEFPILLSNGNFIDSGDHSDGTHWAQWEDPFKKPTYLFALVAGELGKVTGEYITKSGRKIDLNIYCDPGQESRCNYAVECLQKSMKWDEDRFGLEYDLDLYQIVAVDSFNMGAMENKGLNIFNSSCVLADPKTATDRSFYFIEKIIGHEYFHNWTGNRVTCRDWFQLTLKEGLTVFRDQEFSADLNSKAVERLSEVQKLRTYQFAEDAGPMAHPIRPKSYVAMNNFYTTTVYNKGSEVIRMVHTLLGEEGFQAGMKKYFELYDGKAVTTDDFLYAMSTANNNYDFSKFMTWYNQSGTPSVYVKSEYNSDSQSYTLNLDQTYPKRESEAPQSPFVIPLKYELISSEGQCLKTDLLVLDDDKKSFTFEGIKEKPVLGLNLEFSAPVNIENPENGFEQKSHLIKYSQDGFNRYECLQSIYEEELMSAVKSIESDFKWNNSLQNLFENVLSDKNLDGETKSKMLSVPGQSLLHLKQNPIEYIKTDKVQAGLVKFLVEPAQNQMLEIYSELQEEFESFQYNGAQVQNRSLKNSLLSKLCFVKNQDALKLAEAQYSSADNMTDQMAAFSSIIGSEDAGLIEKYGQLFYEQWKNEPLVLQSWVGLMAGAQVENYFDHLLAIENDSNVDLKVPNFSRTLYHGLLANFKKFHDPSGKGYEFFTSRLKGIDDINPQVASRLLTISSLRDLSKFPKNEQTDKLTKDLKAIVASGLSAQASEVLNKTFETLG